MLVADARLTVLRELRDLAQRVRDTAQARFDAGDAPRLEVLQASWRWRRPRTRPRPPRGTRSRRARS